MKKKILAMVLSLAMAVSMLPAASVQAEGGVTTAAETQLSEQAADFGPQATTVSSSGTTGDRNLESIRDAKWEPKGNMGNLSTYVPGNQGWGNWGMQVPAENYYYVQYDWAQAVTTNWMQLYWWDDNGGLGAPAELKILYKDANSVSGDDAVWKEAAMITDFSTAKALGQYNVIKFEEISAKSIRLAMQKRVPDAERPSINGIGICRWKVMEALSDDDKDKAALTLPEKTDEDFSLPATTLSGKSLTWESSDPTTITVEGNTAKVAKVNAETAVTMTAKVNGEVFKTIIVKVMPSAEKIDLATITVPGYPYTTEYNGADQWPVGVGQVIVGDVTLREWTNYTCSGTFQSLGVKNAGERTVILTAKEGDKLCTGSKTLTYTITPKALADENVTLEQEEYTYVEGAVMEPAVTVKVTLNGEETTLEKDTDYTVTYSNNTAPGAGTVTVTGKGNFGGTIQKSFSINEAGKTAIGAAEVTLEKDVYLETGAAIEPGVTSVVLGEKALVKDTDYTVSYINNEVPGTAEVVIAGKGDYTGSVKKTFTIQKDLNKADVTFTNNGIYEYTGEAIAPVIQVVKYGGKDLAYNVDWVPVMPEGEVINPGVYEMGITSEGITGNACGGSKTVTFKVVKRLTEADVTVNGEYMQTGAQIKPDITVKVTLKEDGQDVEKTLVKDTDYTVEYGENNTVGEEAGTVIVKGKGDYTGTVTKKFAIKEDPSFNDKIDLGRVAVTFPNEGKYEYTGAEIQPIATVKDGEASLAYGSDFTAEYPQDVTSVGEKSVTVNPGSNGKYRNSKTAVYEIKARTLTDSNAQVTLTMPENVEEGTQIKPEVSVKVTVNNYAYEWYQEGNATITHDLVKDTDYTVEYGENKTPGADAGSVTITGKGNYTGSVIKKFDIPGSGQEVTKTDLKDAVITVPNCTYNKKAQTPAVTVNLGDKTLVKDTDYTVSYANNTNAGTAKVIITAKEGSAYSGTAEKSFTINKANATIKAKNITKTAGEKNFSFGASVNSGGKLSYKSSKTKVIKVVKGKAQITGVGTSKITISAAATANYKAATKTINIKVNKPKKATLSKVESKKSGQLKISWKKDAKAAGYKVIYSTDKKFKNKKVTKTVTIKKNKTVSKTIKKLKKGKKYYVKVCSYAKIGKKEVLGSYSKVKSVKIKK